LRKGKIICPMGNLFEWLHFIITMPSMSQTHFT
jgi:hypothetical protein